MTPEELIAKDLKFGCVFGPAGSGKTHLIRQAIKLQPNWGIMCATTGAAARVLGSDIRTLHAELGVHDTECLEASAAQGDLHDILLYLRRNYERIVVDESSMLPRGILDILVPASEEVGMGLILVGDFLQLPPVNKENGFYHGNPHWLFKSPLWPKKFRQNIVTLETQYRFHDSDYISGINCLRGGNGLEAVEYFKRAGVTFLPQGTPNTDFNGTCVTGTIAQKNLINRVRYAALHSAETVYPTSRWGEQLPDWEREIPESIGLKAGCRVMILRNLYSFAGELLQANGELGTVLRLYPNFVIVKRDDKTVVKVEMFDTDNGKKHRALGGMVIDKEPTGGVTYMPLTRAWAMHCHKVQGLTLTQPTRVIMENFFSQPAMVYVGCSRVADPKHLIIVGGDTTVRVFGSDVPESFYDEPRLATLCNMDFACRAYL